MFKNIPIPPSYSLIHEGKVFLLLREEYKDFLLGQEIEDLNTFLEKNLQNTRYFSGRTLHPSIPIKNGKRIVLRQYSHGGLFQALMGSLYLFGSRSFQELAFTEEIRSCGIPTIQPVAAVHQAILGPLYRAYLLSLELPHSGNLIQYLQQIGSHPSRENLARKRKTIRSAGLSLQKFHQAGFFHGDLQLKNVLVVGDEILLIDFDRSYWRKALSMRERMKNLLRLNRSVEKWKRVGLPVTRTDRWRFFLAYAGEDVTIRRAMERAIRTYSLRYLFYRFGWTLQKLVGS